MTSASGATFDLANPINRVTAEVVSGGERVSVQVDGGLVTVDGGLVTVDGGLVTVDGAAKGPGRTQVKLVYERARSNSTAPWSPVSQFRTVDDADVVSTIITV